jgi:nucleoid-associated protein YgaU
MRSVVLFFALLGGGLVPASNAFAQAEPAPRAAPDLGVSGAVWRAVLADPYLDPRVLTLTISGDVVRVSCTSPSGAVWARARDVIAAVDGVAQVLMLDPQPEDDREQSWGPASPATSLGDAWEDAVALGTPTSIVFELPEAEGSGALHRAASGDRPRTYTVQAGDSLSIIASRTMGDGTAWPRIHELNRSVIGPNPERVREGMVLRIPQD